MSDASALDTDRIAGCGTREVAKSASNPVEIHFGEGAFDTLPELIGARRCILVTSRSQLARGVASRLKTLCGPRLVAVADPVASHPEVGDACSLASTLEGVEAELIVAVGGGSVIDAAKALSAQRRPRFAAADDAAEPGWLAAHLCGERPLPSGFCPVPLIAVPTTAGTGSEVTPWATLWDGQGVRKRSLSHPALHPEHAVVDPQLLCGLPREVAVSAGLDALSHALESLWSCCAGPVSDALALNAVQRLPAALRSLTTSAPGVAIRRELAEGSLCAGLAISRTRTALAHSISYPLTAELGLCHGLACSFTLPELLECAGAAAPERMGRVARALGASSVAGAARELTALLTALGVGERLRAAIPDASTIAGCRGPFLTPERADHFPVRLAEADARRLAARAWERLMAPPDRTQTRAPFLGGST